jgi:hypothetical protein
MGIIVGPGEGAIIYESKKLNNNKLKINKNNLNINWKDDILKNHEVDCLSINR